MAYSPLGLVVTGTAIASTWGNTIKANFDFMASGAAGQVLQAASGVPAWTSSPTIGGGLTISAGGLAVVSGGIGSGGAQSALAQFNTTGTKIASGGYAIGYFAASTLQAAGPGDTLAGVYVNPNYDANGQASTTAYGVYINAPSGAATNVGLYSLGQAWFANRIAFVANASLNGPGSIYKDALYGLSLYGVTGSSYDFGIHNNAGQSYMVGITGTQRTQFFGTIGIGTAPFSWAGVYITGALLSAANNQYGMIVNPTMSSGATTSGQAIYVALATAFASFAMGSGYGIIVDSPSIGTGSSVANLHGLHVNNQGQAGVTNAVGVFIAAQSGASGVNLGLYNLGTTRLDGSVGVGGPPTGTVGIYLPNTLSLTGSTQYGVLSQPTFSSSATTSGQCLAAQVVTAASFTMGLGTGLYVYGPSIGSGSVVTSPVGVYVANQGVASKTTTAYGVYIEAQSGASTFNVGLYNAGLTHFANHVLFPTDATYDIGASGATRPRHIYASGTITATTVVATTVSATINSAIAGAGNNLALGANNAQSWQINSANGHIQPSSDNTYDLGASGNRVANVVVGSTVRIGTNPASTGAIRLANNVGVYARNAVNSGDLALLALNASNNVVVGDDSAANAEIRATADVRFYHGGALVAYVNGSGVQPGADNAWDLGTASVLRWRDVYCARGAFNGSSRSLKRDFARYDPAAALAAVRATEIVRYRYKPMGSDDQNAERWHVGFVAEDAPDALSPDHATVTPQTTASVALAAIQEIARRLERLEASIAGG